DAIVSAMKQRDSQLFFKRAYPRRHIRLHGIQLACGAIHAANLGDRGKEFQIGCIHGGASIELAPNGHIARELSRRSVYSRPLAIISHAISARRPAVALYQ